MRLERDRNDEHHEEDEQNVDQRRRVDLHHRIVFGSGAANIHSHGICPLTAELGFGDKTDFGDA